MQEDVVGGARDVLDHLTLERDTHAPRARCPDKRAVVVPSPPPQPGPGLVERQARHKERG